MKRVWCDCCRRILNQSVPASYPTTCQGCMDFCAPLWRASKRPASFHNHIVTEITFVADRPPYP